MAIEGDNYSVNYGYDSYGRFNSLTNGADNFSYSYLANSELLSSTTLPNGITSTKTYEAKRNLLSSIENKHNSDTVSKFEYANDAIGRRTSVAKSGTAFSAADTIDYGYNSRSELLSAVAKNDAAYNYAYNFDNIGNRISSSESGTALGYTSNFLNQYIGITGRNGISYDLDGNMLTDGSGWTYTWDAENRLNSAIKGTQRLEFKYDYASRRIEKKVFNGEILSIHKKYLYDGWNLIAEYDALNVLNSRSYVWGLDLTQTIQGAGGVGGLLSVKDSSGTYYSCYDGNGNVTQYLDASGNKVASYDYNPFGRVSSKAGTKADDMPFQFSTKYLDNETELSYYGYRYYSPILGRWINRDPIGERGGWNLYGMVKNNAIGRWDKLGLSYLSGMLKNAEESCRNRCKKKGCEDTEAYKSCRSNCVYAMKKWLLGQEDRDDEDLNYIDNIDRIDLSKLFPPATEVPPTSQESSNPSQSNENNNPEYSSDDFAKDAEQFYDKMNQVIDTYEDITGKTVPGKDIPKNLQKALETMNAVNNLKTPSGILDNVSKYDPFLGTAKGEGTKIILNNIGYPK